MRASSHGLLYRVQCQLEDDEFVTIAAFASEADAIEWAVRSRNSFYHPLRVKFGNHVVKYEALS